MYPIVPHPKRCYPNTSLSSSFIKEDLLSVPSTRFPGQTSNPNQYVGGDTADSSLLDSTSSKYTKCTNGSQSSIFDDSESQYFVIENPRKSLGKQLKKEMKNQKIKRKQQEKKNLNIQKNQNLHIYKPDLLVQGSWSIHCLSEKKNLDNCYLNSTLDYKIQKLTQICSANLTPQKRIHTESASAPTKTSNLFQYILQLDLVQEEISKTEDFKSKQNLFGEQTRIIQQLPFQNSKLNTSVFGKYFIDDLRKEIALQKSKKLKSKNKNSKINFIKNLLKHSQEYQLPIESAKPKDSQIVKINLERKAKDQGKKTLLIDLDDTLIYTSKPMQLSELKEGDLKISQNDGKYRKLYLRPYARQFLARISQFYELIIFTAATKCYAQQIKQILDPQENIISHLLDRQFCFNPNKSTSQNKLPFIKDLRRLNRDLSQTVLLDNSIYCFWYQINNGIPIISYNKDDRNDNELLKVQQYLMEMLIERDVRQKNMNYFKLEEYEQHVDAETLVKQLYMEHRMEE